MQHPSTGELWSWRLDGLKVTQELRLTTATRWRAMSLALQMNIIAAGDPLPTPAPAPLGPFGAVTNRLVQIRSSLSSMCLALPKGQWKDGARLQQEVCQRTSPEQMFWLTTAGTIVSALGRVIEVGGGSMVNGAFVNMGSDVGRENQHWRFATTGPSFFRNGGDEYAIVNEQSGKVLEIGGLSTNAGAPIQQWEWLGGSNQRWLLQTATAAFAYGSTTGLFRVSAQHSSSCLSLAGATLQIGTQLRQWSCNGTPAQTFWFVQGADGHRIITSTGQVLDVRAASRQNGAPIIQWEWLNDDNQRWLLLPLGQDIYAIQSKFSGQVMDVAAESRDNGVPIVQWPFERARNQMWMLERVNP